MKTYITIPRPAKAVQIIETDFTADHPNPNHMPGVYYMPAEKQAIINTPFGQTIALPGDWIVKDHKGHLHRMTASEFADAYTVTNNSALDSAMREALRLTGLLNALPNPLPGSKWEQRYLEWWYAWKKNGR